MVTHVGFGLTWLFASNRMALYQVPLLRNRRQALRILSETWLIAWGIAGMTATIALQPPSLNPWIVFAVGLGLMGSLRILLANSALARGSGRPRTLVLGACANAHAISAGEDARKHMELIGFATFTGEDAAAMPHLDNLGSFEELNRILQEQGPNLILACPSDDAPSREISVLFRTCDRMGITVQYFPSFLQVTHMQPGMTWAGDRIGLALRTHYNRSISRLAKRSIDILGASIGLLLLLPVFLACALAVKLTSRGPVFYRQTRVGQNGEHFTCLKFRSMRTGSDVQREKLRTNSIQDGPAFKIPDDPRITAVGKLLRKFSLDELPQLLNVLIGDMSLVGPRPPIPSEVEQYTWWQRRRIMVKPGLTCVWQVWGRNRVSFKRWVEMDIYYIDNWSLWMDLKLIAHTLRVVIRGTGM